MTIIVRRNRPLDEVFENVAKASGKDEKVKVLRRYSNNLIYWYVDQMYNKDWSSIKLPKFKYSTTPYGANYTNLYRSINRLNQAYHYRDINPELTEKNLQLVLGYVSEGEARLIVGLIEGKRVTGVSKAVFKELYPQLFQNDEEVEDATV